jgi:hypothetical protein
MGPTAGGHTSAQKSRPGNNAVRAAASRYTD